MEISEILSKVDHTLLAVDATWDEIKGILDDGIKFGTASVCIPASYVAEASAYAAAYAKENECEKLKICTVIGFPNGYSTTNTKVYETWDAVHAGADEIDMVINIGWVKDKRYDDVLKEIKEVRRACPGKILKVIIETCLLTDEEKIRMCEIVSASGADFIKTSTGFSKGGATFDDVKLMREHTDKSVRVKAAGGIASLEDAEKFIALGADRLGTSRIVKIAKEKA